MTNSSYSAVPTYIRVKSNDNTKIVVRYDDGHISVDNQLLFQIAEVGLNSKEDNLSDALEEMKAVIYEKYGKVKISERLIEIMEEFFIDRTIPKRLDYNEPRFWTTGRLPANVRKEYEDGRREEIMQIKRESWK